MRKLVDEILKEMSPQFSATTRRSRELSGRSLFRLTDRTRRPISVMIASKFCRCRRASPMHCYADDKLRDKYPWRLSQAAWRSASNQRTTAQYRLPQTSVEFVESRSSMRLVGVGAFHNVPARSDFSGQSEQPREFHIFEGSLRRSNSQLGTQVLQVLCDAAGNLFLTLRFRGVMFGWEQQ
jgi:hypothetical protein